jgi:Protein of unknown function (DUF2996)
MTEESAAKPTAKKAKPVAASDAPTTPAAKAAPPKKEKAPAVEDKPFADFIQQDYIPALQQALTTGGISDLQVGLERAKVAVRGFQSAPECSQIVGRWDGGNRQFNIYFFDDNIQGQRAFSYADRGNLPSTIEPFLIDERKITLDLLIFGLITRLNGQKWLSRN